MSQSEPDRLDRIEATLERVSQQLDNQVVVNAELRQSTTELRQSTTELRQTTALLTNAVNVLVNSVTTLTNVVTNHATEIREIREDMHEMQSSILGLQTENRRILEHLERDDN